MAANKYVYLTNVRDSDTSRGYAAHTIAQFWQQGSVTWNNMPHWGAEFARGTLGNSPGWQMTDVTSLARDWVKNPSSGIRWYDVYYTTDTGVTWRIGRAQVTTIETNVIGAPNGAKSASMPEPGKM